MEEILCSIHNYTKFSGGTYSFYDMAQAALDCGLDSVFTTDKNIFPRGHNQFYYRDGKRVLVNCGEELFDPVSDAPLHYLSLGIEKEQFNRSISNPQDEIRILPGPDLQIKQFRHIELINAQHLLHQGLNTGMKTIRENMNIFESLLRTEQRYIGLAGTCSSDLKPKFSYPELFSTAMNHVLCEEKLNGDLIHDKLQVLKALKTGHVYIALDGLSDARGFRFSAEGDNLSSPAYSGDTIYLKNSITLKISVPEACVCRLLRSGKVIKEWQQCKQVPFTIYETGYYRVECALSRKRNLYDWIFSNPIYVARG